MYGLVLEGGGCKGSYQAGALKALEEQGVEYSCVAGTSVGALNGAMVVQEDIQGIYDVWYNIDPAMVFRLSEEEAKKLNVPGSMDDSIYSRLRRLHRIIADRGLDVEPLERMVRDSINEDLIRKSPVGFGIVTFDLTERKPIEIYKEDIPEGKIADYLVASASFPGFRPKNIDGRVYIDGGVYNTLPVNLVKDKGCTSLIVIRTFGYGRLKKVDRSGLDIMEIAPVESLGPILDFSTGRARRNLKLGYFDGMRAIKGLKGKKYYLKNNFGEKLFIEYLAGLSEEKIKRVAGIFGIQGAPGRRLLFESIVPRIAEMLDISQTADYEELCVALLEKLAESSGVERFKVYDIEEFLKRIEKSYKVPREGLFSEMPGFVKRMDFVSRIAREKIIGSLAGEIFDDLMGRQKDDTA